MKRLRNCSQFLDASYEVWVAGVFIRAGFAIEFEDESNSNTSHCEFTARFLDTGKCFSVEVKRRQPGTRPELVGRNLKKALDKHANHTRVIAIEANVPQSTSAEERSETMRQVLEGLREREIRQPFSNKEAEPAYIIVTNSPFQHHPENEIERWVLGEGFKIPDFKFGVGFATVRDLVESRDRHVEIFCLLQSMSEHNPVPITFDGKIPELVFGETHGPLIIGDLYEIPTVTGGEVSMELISAVVDEVRCEALCVMRSADGRNCMVACPLTPDEFSAFKRHPETFFGKIDKSRSARDPIDLYDHFVQSYLNSPKQDLLEMMNSHYDASKLDLCSQPELVKIFAERITQSIVNQGVFDVE